MATAQKDIVRGYTGWYVVDKNGFCSGPYTTASDALYAINPKKES
jgi:hypothetical protein